MRRSAFAATLAAALGCGALAHAAPPTPEEKGQAEALFRDGRTLMTGGSYPEACAKFEESQKLDPQLGTLLNLAVCHASEGKTASGWAEFREVAELSEKEHDKERARFARQQAAQLEKKLARLTLRVASPSEDLVIQLDGQPIGPSAWTSALPVDPGDHVIEASAPGRRAHRQTARVVAAATVEIAVPALEQEPAPPLAPAPAPLPPAQVEAPASSPARETRTLGFVIGGVGLAGLVVGTVFGLETMSRKNDADKACPGDVCSPEGHDLETAARRDAIVSTIAFGVGLAGLAVGTYLVLSDRKGGAPATVSVRPGPLGLRLDARF